MDIKAFILLLIMCLPLAGVAVGIVLYALSKFIESIVDLF